MIPVTQPFLPTITEYTNYLEGIWERNWLTNNGPLVNQLESELQKYLNINDVLFISNGTIAIQLAIKALNLTGDIITTPFSYVATTSSIVWENCKPIFVDIHPESYNINPAKIEQSITSDTSAILATHVFGNPCDIDTLETISKKYNIPVIYDAAHCFGVKFKQKSIFSFGDISTTSFHATKLFHTIEGGAVFSNDERIIEHLTYLRNFGHNGPEKFFSVGINAKNSEFHAAMGLCNLKYIDNILNVRKKQYSFYLELLDHTPIRFQQITSNTEYNYSYFSILLPTNASLTAVNEVLTKHKIFARRYFYPSLSKLPYVGEWKTPVSDQIASRILCLPLYHSMTEDQQTYIAKLIKDKLKSI